MKRTARQLTEIELRGSADVAEYSTTLRELLTSVAMELEMTAAELRHTLEHSTGTALDRGVARLKARKVARRLMRARELMQAASLEAGRLWTDYAREYSDLIQPSGKRAAWRWEN